MKQKGSMVVLRTSTRLLFVSAVLLSACLISCLEDECITVSVTNNSDEAVIIHGTECWPLAVTVEPDASSNLFVLAGEIVSAESEGSGTNYSHIYTNEYDTWEIN